MNLLPEKVKCTGCSACFAACPRNAISMSADSEGFLYPCIDESLCVKCGLCKKICPSLNQECSCEPLEVYAARAKDDVLREQSSSGGMFTLLARETIKSGGLVFGAAFDHDDWHVFHRGVDNDNDLSELRGSKYVQSDMGNVFREIKAELSLGRNVMFSGTPCQILGLRNHLGAFQDFVRDRLLLVEVVCHGVPSPLAWKKYLENRVADAYKMQEGGLRKIRNINCRCKKSGWKRYSLSIVFANDKEYIKDMYDDSFIRGFRADLYNRPSCHECPCKSLKSGADLTIGDYWGVRLKFMEMDDNKGTSLVLVNSEKGLDSFSKIMDSIVWQPSDFSHCCKSNSVIVFSAKPHRKRSIFFKRISRSAFDNLVELLLRPPLMQRFRTKLGMVFRKLGLRK